ncbi:hypothetical protein VPHK394_0039 [Vibrio phage K394]
MYSVIETNLWIVYSYLVVKSNINEVLICQVK